MNRRRWLWPLLITLIAALLVTLVWLVGRFEQSRFEDQLERDAGQWSTTLRFQLARNAQQLSAMATLQGAAWDTSAAQWLQAHPEAVRIERRDLALHTVQISHTPFSPKGSQVLVFKQLGRTPFLPEVAQACALAQRVQDSAYSRNYFVPLGNGLGSEISELCMTTMDGNNHSGYLVVTYALEGWLKEWVAPQANKQHEISFVEADGARLAVIGASTRRGDRYIVQSLLDLQGNTLVLRIETWAPAPFWLANTASALVLAFALALGIVLWLLFRDTRKRLKAEQSLRLSQERLQRIARLASLGEMASMLSHEINQPLAAITSYAEGSLDLLAQTQCALSTESSPKLPQEVFLALTRIAEQSQRASKVIKSVNDFVRRRETERVIIAPEALLDAVLPLLRLQATQIAGRVMVHIEASVHDVWCDKILIEQVLINLARNGLQAMQTLPSHAPRELTLCVSNSGPHLVLFEVLDTGAGLAPEVASQLFTPFFTTKDEGTGLGLSLCRTVIEQHGGALSYTTSATGTHFRFNLARYLTSPKDLRYASTASHPNNHTHATP
jgi:C4-dicarboxylate-specific signal transduction histidine kinase